MVILKAGELKHKLAKCPYCGTELRYNCTDTFIISNYRDCSDGRHYIKCPICEKDMKVDKV